MGSLYNNPSSKKSESKAQEHEKRTEKSGGNNLRKDKKTRRVDSHHLHSINLLGDSHTADLGCDVGSHLAGKNQGNHSGAELQDKAFPHHISDVHLVNYRILKIGCRLDDKDSSDKKGNYSDKQNR